MEEKLQLSKSQEQGEATSIRNFQAIIGSLLYLVIETRPDLAFSVTKLAQFASNPNATHELALQRVMRYLIGTVGHALRLGGSDDNLIHGFVDSDWATDQMDRRSISGYCFQIGPIQISNTAKQGHVGC